MSNTTKPKYPIDLGDLQIRSRFDYTVTRWLVRKDQVQITVSVGGQVIGDRMTKFDRLFALACCVHGPAEIARLRSLIQAVRADIELLEAIQRRDPVALAQDAQARGWDERSDRGRCYLRDREERIRAGEFARRARSNRKTLVLFQRELDSAPTGPSGQPARPYIYSWHQGYALDRRRLSLRRAIEVVQIPTRLPAAMINLPRNNPAANPPSSAGVLPATANPGAL